jgi:hypothetical protein
MKLEEPNPKGDLANAVLPENRRSEIAGSALAG